MLSTNEIKRLCSLKQKKYREKEKKFLIEGFHLIEEILKSDYDLQKVIIRSDVKLNEHQNIFPALKRKHIRIEPVTAGLFNKLSETKNSPGIIGVAGQNSRSVQDYSNSDVIIALDRINDPGNLGTILRTAYWFGVKTVLLSTGSVDVFNSKVLRSSQGALFHLNIERDVDLTEELIRLQSSGFQILLFEPDGNGSLSDVNKSGKCVLVFGNESGGISHLLLDMKYKSIKIDSKSDCESLNVAVACGIALYSVQLQRVKAYTFT